MNLDNDFGASLQDEQLFELIICPHSDLTKRSDFQIIYHTQPDLLTSKDSDGVFHSSDLWTPHTLIRGLWKWVGRKVDMISLSNGVCRRTHFLPVTLHLQYPVYK
ncbi:hypothetical protein J3R30DRAFT_3563690 [Lentinula aciculospora]|uniref:Uncharacterized protein n=1 Tax=Lentinula aciculospora TaxID=153920 RepID=A0A9W9DG42_9AGAR|nr:hypothetical protein J3R30DRAFT_3563690 [Lentinula aciculospora]